ncbi:hypothetical protein QZH41_000466 [Actinostola sp. cb2023]|nr:hypothetical protein QZH41_000466 [Actinostola sp. cb2023]
MADSEKDSVDNWESKVDDLKRDKRDKRKNKSVPCRFKNRRGPGPNTMAIQKRKDEWFELELYPDNVEYTPRYVVSNLLKDKKDLKKENEEIVATLYESMEEASILRERYVNSLIEQGSLEIDNLKVNLEFFLGGDYKFLLIAMGMKAANSSHSCIWCKVSSAQRCELCLTREYFNSPEMKRVLNNNWTKEKGCKGKPLFNIPVDHVVCDELHMLLRITDRLENGIILEAINWDQQDAFYSERQSQNTSHLDALIRSIKSCGVSFSVWDGKDGKKEWTSLMGNDKKRLLKLLPEKFPDILKPETCGKDFRKLFEIFTANNPTEAQITGFHSEVLDLQSGRNFGERPRSTCIFTGNCIRRIVPESGCTGKGGFEANILELLPRC